ncbi:g10006 [Coccomyxa elongata]
MWFFYAISLPLTLIGVVYTLLYMPSRGTGWLVKVNVGSAWICALATLILVPSDVYHALQGQHLELLRQWWRISYWYGFIAQFTILPLHQEYIDSGAFTVCGKLGSALRNNLIFYAVLTAVGAFGLVLLLITGELAPANVLGFCVAASNAFGLIAGIFLMGYGLVAVPRQLWLTANIQGAQNALCHKAGLQAEKALAAQKELEKAAALVQKVSATFGRRDSMRPYMDRIEAMISESGEASVLGAGDMEDGADLDYFDLEDLARLRRHVRKAIEDTQREREVYHDMVLQYLEVSDVLSNRLKRGQPFVSSTRQRQLPVVLGHIEWWWRCILRGWVYRLLALITAGLSIAVVLAEATISPYVPNLSVFSHALHETAGNELATELLTFVSLAYPCLCAYYALFRLGRFSFYMLVPRHTSAYSLLANAMLMSRFAPPLAFNFMAGIALPPSKAYSPGRDVTDTVFYQEFGVLMMHQPLIGWDFTTYLPVALVPYMLLLVFNVFNRVASMFTRSSSIEFDDDFETRSGAAAKGLRLLQVELDNFSAGRPLGLTITTAGRDEGRHGSAAAFRPESRHQWSWWSRPQSSLLADEHPPGSSADLDRGVTRVSDQCLEQTRLANGPSSSNTQAVGLDSIFARLSSVKDTGVAKPGPLNVDSDQGHTNNAGASARRWQWPRK